MNNYRVSKVYLYYTLLMIKATLPLLFQPSRPYHALSSTSLTFSSGPWRPPGRSEQRGVRGGLDAEHGATSAANSAPL